MLDSTDTAGQGGVLGRRPVAQHGVVDLVLSLPGVSCEGGALLMMNAERKRTTLKVVIAKIEDAIQELRGLDYVGDKWALIADLLRVRNDLDTELEITP